MQSGTSLNQWAQAKAPKRAAFAIGQLLDIRTNDTRELVEQLRKVDYRTLHVVSVSTDLGVNIQITLVWILIANHTFDIMANDTKLFFL